jgi:hypothetical protein
MAAEIIQFPKKNQPLKIAKSVDLHYCWDCRLNNPLLNSIFKSEVCYVERWFLQTRHLLNNEEVEHPLIKTLLNNEDCTLNLLIESTEKDLAVQRYFADVAYKDATDINISKLNRWLVKWQGLQQYRQRS